MKHLVSLTPAVQADSKLVQRLLDDDQLECTVCQRRPAVCVRGVYGDIALCSTCESGVSEADLRSNFGEVAQ